MELSADDSRNSLKAALLPSGQAFTSLEESLSALPSDCEMDNKEFESLQQIDGNLLCIDCGAANPDWGSPNLGILFCFQCSGQHRYVFSKGRVIYPCHGCCRCTSWPSLQTPLSSTSVYPRTDFNNITKQPHFNILPFFLSIYHSGLGTHISFVRSVTLDQWTAPQLALMRAGGNGKCRRFLEQHGISFDSSSTIRQRYDSPAAALYKQVLLARVQGLPEPTQLTETTRQPQVSLKDKIQGFGSSPMPEPESNVNWIKIAGAVVVIALVAGGVAAAVYFLR
jgi:hypothetical protein